MRDTESLDLMYSCIVIQPPLPPNPKQNFYVSHVALTRLTLDVCLALPT